MLARRIIPCLDVKDGRVVNGINFLQSCESPSPSAAIGEPPTLASGRPAATLRCTAASRPPAQRSTTAAGDPRLPTAIEEAARTMG